MRSINTSVSLTFRDVRTTSRHNDAGPIQKAYGFLKVGLK